MQAMIEVVRDEVLPAVRAGRTRVIPGSSAPPALDPSMFLEMGTSPETKHYYFELMWLLTGRAHLKIGDDIYPVDAGDCCLLPPETWHSDVYDRGTAEYTSLWFSYWPGIVNLTLFLYQPFGQWRIVSHSFSYCSTRIGTYLVELEQEINARQSYRQDTINALLTQLMVAVLRGIENVDSTTDGRWMPQGQVSGFVLKYLHDHYAKPIGLSDVARVVHLTPQYLTTRFKQETGLSVFEQLTQIRMDHAARLLLEERLPLRQVAEAVGYNLSLIHI